MSAKRRSADPFILCVGGGKGGTGKTTIAANLAIEGMRLGLEVLAIDVDVPQASLATWGEVALENEVARRPQLVRMGENIRQDLSRVAKGFGLVVIDCPGVQAGKEGSARIAAAAFTVADFVLLPVAPGPTDVWTIQRTVEALEDVRALRPQLAAGIVLNKLGKNGASRTLREAVKGLSVPVLRSELRLLETVPNAIAVGQGVTTFKPNSPAAKEFSRLYREVVKHG